MFTCVCVKEARLTHIHRETEGDAEKKEKKERSSDRREKKKKRKKPAWGFAASEQHNSSAEQLLNVLCARGRMCVSVCVFVCASV